MRREAGRRLARRASRPARVLAARLVAVIALFIALLPAAGATAYRQLAPAQALLAADLVVLASVLDVSVEVDGDLVWTVVNVRVEREFGVHGDSDDEEGPDGQGPGQAEQGPSPAELGLRFLGGAPVGEPPLFVAGMPTFVEGDRLLMALYRDDGLASPVVGFEQGLWRLEGGGARDSSGYYLGLVPVAGEEAVAQPGSQDDDAPPPPPPSDLVLGRASEPTDLNTLFDAVARLLAGEESLARPAVAARAPAQPPADAGSAGDAGEVGELAAGVYAVSDFGGPLLLSDAVEQAAASWIALAPDSIVLVGQPDAAARFEYGDEELFGEDTFALTLIRSGGSLSLLSPLSGEMLGAALRHELGLVLGLAETGPDGALPRAVAPDSVPGAAQLAALRALARLVPGDLDGDGRVDLADLLEFAARYGRSGLNEPADLDSDGIVDDDDLVALRELYEFLPPQEGP